MAEQEWLLGWHISGECGMWKGEVGKLEVGAEVGEVIGRQFKRGGYRIHFGSGMRMRIPRFICSLIFITSSTSYRASWYLKHLPHNPTQLFLRPLRLRLSDRQRASIK